MPFNLIFDFDGTIHDSNRVYAPALRRNYAVLAARCEVPLRNFSDDQIAKWLGWSPRDMWNTFAPGLSDESKKESIARVGRGMLEGIEPGNCALSPGTEEALQELLDQGNTLIFLSNCRHDYMEACRKAFGLDRFFAGYYCAEDYDQIPKPQIFEHVRRDFGDNGLEFVAIGDRFHDMELAYVHGLRSIGCLYGFGDPEELRDATARVEAVTAIPAVVAGWER